MPPKNWQYWRLRKKVTSNAAMQYMAVDGMFAIHLNRSYFDITTLCTVETPVYFVVVEGFDDYVYTSPSMKSLDDAIVIYNEIRDGYGLENTEGWV